MRVVLHLLGNLRYTRSDSQIYWCQWMEKVDGEKAVRNILSIFEVCEMYMGRLVGLKKFIRIYT